MSKFMYFDHDRYLLNTEAIAHVRVDVVTNLYLSGKRTSEYCIKFSFLDGTVVTDGERYATEQEAINALKHIALSL